VWVQPKTTETGDEGDVEGVVALIVRNVEEHGVAKAGRNR
jgi:hypothetical protein